MVENMVRRLNPSIFDNAEYEYNGHVHVFHKVIEYNEDGEPDETVSFEIVRSIDHKTIGTTTAYISQERLESLFYRFYHHDHMKPFRFIARVRVMNGGGTTITYDDGSSTTVSCPSYYVVIPSDIAKDSDVVVDDEISYTVTNPHTGIPSDEIYYHVSRYGKNLVVNLKRSGQTFDIGQYVEISARSFYTAFGRFSLNTGIIDTFNGGKMIEPPNPAIDLESVSEVPAHPPNEKTP